MLWWVCPIPLETVPPNAISIWARVRCAMSRPWRGACILLLKLILGLRRKSPILAMCLFRGPMITKIVSSGLQHFIKISQKLARGLFQLAAIIRSLGVLSRRLAAVSWRAGSRSAFCIWMRIRMYSLRWIISWVRRNRPRIGGLT